MELKKELIAQFGEVASQLRVGDIEFSGSTYQVQVFEGEQELWPFLQFDPSGEIGDCFCSCIQAEKEGSCPHLAAALLNVFGDDTQPIHIRFQVSLWHILCRIFSDQQGPKPSGLIKEEGKYTIETPSGKVPFWIEGKEEGVVQLLSTMIDKRVKETEENSIKFSGLSFEELTLWREGRPSERLRYELSFWSDLAKWLFLLQERKSPYKITFETDKEGIPTRLKALFKEVELAFYLSRANLPRMIPGFATVKGPLKVFEFQEEAIDKVIYDPVKKSLHIQAKQERGEATVPKEAGAIKIEEWLFVAGKGFYSREQHALLRKSFIPQEEIGAHLTAYHKTLRRHLEGLHKEPLPLRYHLSFDSQWNLHIVAYLFEVGDFQGGGATFFGDWVYLKEDGFYPLEDRLFEEVETVILEADVSGFVHRYRIWLGTQNEFHPHLTTIEAQLTYEVDEEGVTFTSRPGSLVEEVGNHDFNDWIYVAQQGFYSKAKARGSSRLASGRQVAASAVPFFIRSHREDLELIEGFFTDLCPVIRFSLTVEVVGRDEVKITPSYPLYPEYRDRDVILFGEWVYTRGKGFCAILPDRLPPESFRSTRLLKGEELFLFLEYELPCLAPYIETLDPRLEPPKGLKLKVNDTKTPYSKGLVQVHMAYESKSGKVLPSDVYRALQRGEPYLISEAGLLDLHNACFEWLRRLPPSRISTRQVTLSTLELARLSASEELESAKGSHTQKLIEAMLSLKAPSAPDFSRLKSDLRPYQRVGVDWLWFLYSTGLSGLLCDDMGLGKTHQAMALLAAIGDQDERRPLFLVVCPTSVIYHWEEKLNQFLPHLKVLTYYGPSRQLGNLQEVDIILTTYGIVRQDHDRLKDVSFNVAIFDEIQAAKNPHSRTHKSLLALHSQMKLGLTGTPIENSLIELKALFDLVLPTYFPSDAAFRVSFQLPIEQEGDPHAKALLQKLTRPFVLRRKKVEVLQDLPEKTEERATCTLTPDQQMLYQSVLESTGEQLIGELKDEKKAISYLHVFAILTHLKQICDHPAVHHDEPSAYKSYSSGKWSLFLELLSQSRESGQKVVVFSQYLAMLDIIELYLKEHGIGYASIRGQTLRRDLELKAFAEDPHCEVFVGSLQASGVGIDLTAASVVIHYDRWWNAARENQATDRVHRMGQTRGVQVFKLITKNTIEERIDQLIEGKGALMEEVIGSDDQSQLKSLSRDDLIGLLTVPNSY